MPRLSAAILRQKTATPTAPRFQTPLSTRLFSQTRACREEEDETFEAAVERPRRPFDPERFRKRHFLNDDEHWTEFLEWLNLEGTQYMRPTGEPHYLQPMRVQKRKNKEKEDAALEAVEQEEDTKKGKGDSDRRKGLDNIPFPSNPFFKSQKVLSEAIKEQIYQSVALKGQSVRDASSYYRVSMERVGAVVRMKQMERDWMEQKREKLAPNFSTEIMKMLPQTMMQKDGRPETHESINDLPVHPATSQQMFWPVSESREFSRIDAGEAFKSGLLPADLRIPHPELIERQANKLNMPQSIAMQKLREDLDSKLTKEAAKQAKRQASIEIYEGPRHNIQFEPVNAEWAGKNGRSRKGVGFRYGMPHEDRKRAQIKIPNPVQ
ncbi:hypothetical protein BT63DRAFT_459018 [Microthyrium microscopicum]|uniref:Eukaryotic mitochondrial regulator protein-domain-containing protein n=1 Tax=Microthyrium microscopicum TaxID=703497 RepID=A0A6A6U2F1_9PEZI|nr:hypothetical protein BT63DRAFT_459018 [Microthyrium microscopicum]